MFLSKVSIQRPVLATMMNLALILFGIIGLSRLPVRELPGVPAARTVLLRRARAAAQRGGRRKRVESVRGDSTRQEVQVS